MWGNLGYLYLRLDDTDLANQCFLKAQIIDPDYAQAWLGQGFLAERNGDKEHARALFAHSVTLSAGSLVSSQIFRWGCKLKTSTARGRPCSCCVYFRALCSS